MYKPFTVTLKSGSGWESEANTLNPTREGRVKAGRTRRVTAKSEMEFLLLQPTRVKLREAMDRELGEVLALTNYEEEMELLRLNLSCNILIRDLRQRGIIGIWIVFFCISKIYY